MEPLLTQAVKAAQRLFTGERRGNSSAPVPKAQYPPGIGNYDPLPPFSTKSPNVGPSTKADSDYDHRIVPSNPFDSWWLTLPAKLTPQYVLNILRAAQGGDLWQQWQLFSLMLDQWPMFKKCVHELCEAASSLKFVVKPKCEEGEDPTPRQKERADFVRRCVFGMNPNPFNDEKDLAGLVYHMSMSFPMGMQLSEIIWNPVARAEGGRYERTVKATAFVHPRHFTYTSDGYLVVYDEEYNRLYFSPDKAGQAQPDANRFLCGQYFSHAGNSLSSGMLRALGWPFAAYVFNREWTMLAAQKHGTPFLDLTYKPGTPQGELLALQQFMQNAAADGYVMHLEGSTIQAHAAQAQTSDNPQRRLQEDADRYCQLVMLGQTLTTDVSDKGGAYAASQTHMAVRQDRIEGLGKWVAAQPLTQLARAICRMNYGDEVDCPTVEADFTKPLGAAEKTTLMTAVSGCTVPLPAADVYRMLDMNAPEKGDLVLISGKLGELGDTTEELSAIGDNGLEMVEGQAATDRKAAERGMRRVTAREVGQILYRASDAEVVEIRHLMAKAVEARDAGHLNGEGKAVVDWVAARRRFKVN